MLLFWEGCFWQCAGLNSSVRLVYGAESFVVHALVSKKLRSSPKYLGKKISYLKGGCLILCPGEGSQFIRGERFRRESPVGGG